MIQASSTPGIDFQNAILGQTSKGIDTVPRAVNINIGKFLREFNNGILFRILAPIYRGLFFSTNKFVRMCLRDSIHGHILDVGGGDGMILNTILNQCKIESATFIDPMLNSGILLSGLKVQIFRGQYLNEVKEIQGKKFDLILLVDVIHHVEPADRVQLLSDCLALLSPTGNLVIKEISTRGFGSKIRYWGDVYISRDPVVFFVDQSDLTALLLKIVPGLKIHTFDQYNKTDAPNYAISISH